MQMQKVQAEQSYLLDGDRSLFLSGRGIGTAFIQAVKGFLRRVACRFEWCKGDFVTEGYVDVKGKPWGEDKRIVAACNIFQCERCLRVYSEIKGEMSA